MALVSWVFIVHTLHSARITSSWHRVTENIHKYTCSANVITDNCNTFERKIHDLKSHFMAKTDK